LKERRAATNTGLAKVAVQCSADTFVVNQTLVLRINICGENRHLRQARNRYGQVIPTENKKIRCLFKKILKKKINKKNLENPKNLKSRTN
jgi:hypothetical protein